MKISSKIELLNRLNNKLYGSFISDSFSVNYSQEASGYMEILYREGRISSFRQSKNKLIGVTNVEQNTIEDKVLFENNRYRPTLNYEDISKIKSSLKTFYFHTVNGQKTLEQIKKNRQGGVPIFRI